jgi:hypothetical protein
MLDKRFAEAARLFARSHELHPAPTSALGRGRALVRLGRLRAAYAAYADAASAPVSDGSSDVWRQAVRRAEIELAALAPKVPRVVIVVDGAADAVVELDGERIDTSQLAQPLLVEAGTHRVVARAPGREPHARTFTAAASTQTEIQLTLQQLEQAPPPPRGPSAQSIAGWSFVGLGGAGLVGWAVTGALVLDAKATVEDQCSAAEPDVSACTPVGNEAAARGKALGIANTALLLGGLATTAVGVTLVLTDDGPSEEVAHIRIGPGYFGVGGTF